MFFIHLTLVLFLLGILVWISGAIIVRQKNKQTLPERRKHYEQIAKHLALTAKIIFLLAAVSFVLGFMLIRGSYKE